MDRDRARHAQADLVNLAVVNGLPDSDRRAEQAVLRIDQRRRHTRLDGGRVVFRIDQDGQVELDRQPRVAGLTTTGRLGSSASASAVCAAPTAAALSPT